MDALTEAFNETEGGRGIFVSNREFLNSLFGTLHYNAHVTAFRDDPSAIPQDRMPICWAGKQFEDYDFRLPTGTNQYFCISTFNRVDGRAVRRKSEFLYCYVIVADDVKDKVPEHRATLLPAPSWRLETSPGNEQWGWILIVPAGERWRVDNLLDGLVAMGLAPDGVDPGMKGVTRYVRLPEGWNNKAKYGDPFKCRMLEWRPERKVTMEALAAPFGVDLNARRSDDKDYAGADGGYPDHPVFNHIEILCDAPDGGYLIRCPWDHEHGDRAGSGTWLTINADSSLGFRCHHGHCQGRGVQDFLDVTGARAEIDTWRVFREIPVDENGNVVPGGVVGEWGLVGVPNTGETSTTMVGVHEETVAHGRESAGIQGGARAGEVAVAPGLHITPNRGIDNGTIREMAMEPGEGDLGSDRQAAGASGHPQGVQETVHQRVEGWPSVGSIGFGKKRGPNGNPNMGHPQEQNPTFPDNGQGVGDFMLAGEPAGVTGCWCETLANSAGAVQAQGCGAGAPALGEIGAGARVYDGGDGRFARPSEAYSGGRDEASGSGAQGAGGVSSHAPADRDNELFVPAYVGQGQGFRGADGRSGNGVGEAEGEMGGQSELARTDGLQTGAVVASGERIGASVPAFGPRQGGGGGGRAPGPASQPWHALISTLPPDPASDLAALRRVIGVLVRMKGLEREAALKALKDEVRNHLRAGAIDAEVKIAKQALMREKRKDKVEGSKGFSDIAKQWAYVSEVHRFVHLDNNAMLRQEAFKNRYMYLEEDLKDEAQNSGESIPSDILKAFLMSSQLTKADTLDYRPGHTKLYRDEENGKLTLNLWDTIIDPGVPGDATMWLAHFRILELSDDEINHTLKWLAYTLQHPERKINHILVVGGAEGIGKDFILHPLVQALGDNSKTIDGHELASDFNEHLLATKHLHINELEAANKKERVALSAKLKPLAAAPPMKISVNSKGVAKVWLRNIVNCTATTNEQFQPVEISGGARRYYMLWSNVVMRDVEDQMLPAWKVYWKERWDWMHQNWESCVHYLMTLDVSDFDPGAPPMVTDHQKTVVRASQRPLDRYIEDKLETRDGVFAYPILTPARIFSQLRIEGESTLQEYGFYKLPSAKEIGQSLTQKFGKGRRSRMRSGSKVASHTIYFAQDADQYIGVSDTELVKIITDYPLPGLSPHQT